MSTYNPSTAVFLINKNVRAVLAHYDADEKDKPPAKREMFKTLDPGIKVGDLVFVPTSTRHNITICKVSDVDVEVDHNAFKNVEWIMGVFDTTIQEDYKGIVAKEQQLFDKIKVGEKRKATEELRKTLMAAVDPEEIKLLPIYANGIDAEKK